MPLGISPRHASRAGESDRARPQWRVERLRGPKAPSDRPHRCVATSACQGPEILGSWIGAQPFDHGRNGGHGGSFCPDRPHRRPAVTVIRFPPRSECPGHRRPLEAVVISVGHRLAPEVRFPEAIDDAITALNWVMTGGSELGSTPAKYSRPETPRAATLPRSPRSMIATEDTRAWPQRGATNALTARRSWACVSPGKP
jgi:hypothetical protein